MSDHSQAQSNSRRMLSTGLRVLFPFKSMMTTALLLKQETARNRENWEVIKELGHSAKENLSVKLGRSSGKDQSFAEAMSQRSPGAMSVQDLHLFFLRRKRAAIGACAFFWITGVLGLAIGISDASIKLSIQSLMSIATATPIMFALALSAQLRLWQLQTRRLSSAERGGLKDFINDYPDWLRQTLSLRNDFQSEVTR